MPLRRPIETISPADLMNRFDSPPNPDFNFRSAAADLENRFTANIERGIGRGFNRDIERNVLSLDQALSQASSPRAPPSTPFSQASPSVSIHGINFSRSPRPSGPALGTLLVYYLFTIKAVVLKLF